MLSGWSRPQAHTCSTTGCIDCVVYVRGTMHVPRVTMTKYVVNWYLKSCRCVHNKYSYLEVKYCSPGCATSAILSLPLYYTLLIINTDANSSSTSRFILSTIISYEEHAAGSVEKLLLKSSHRVTPGILSS